MRKPQYLAYWNDDQRPYRRYFVEPRSRVAYLLRAARSRGATIHRIRQCYGWNYQIGEMALVQRHRYHDLHTIVQGG